MYDDHKPSQSTGDACLQELGTTTSVLVTDVDGRDKEPSSSPSTVLGHRRLSKEKEVARGGGQSRLLTIRHMAVAVRITTSWLVNSSSAGLLIDTSSNLWLPLGTPVLATTLEESCGPGSVAPD